MSKPAAPSLATTSPPCPLSLDILLIVLCPEVSKSLIQTRVHPPFLSHSTPLFCYVSSRPATLLLMFLSISPVQQTPYSDGLGERSSRILLPERCLSTGTTRTTFQPSGLSVAQILPWCRGTGCREGSLVCTPACYKSAEVSASKGPVEKWTAVEEGAGVWYPAGARSGL